jgi:hypothetical protein
VELRPWVYWSQLALESTAADELFIISSGAQEETRLLLLGGLPIYQYDGDDGPDVCYCNIPGEWSSVNSSGAGAAFAVTYPA